MNEWMSKTYQRFATNLRYVCRVFLMGATLAGIILLSVDLFKYLFNSSDFSIQQITIEGASRIQEDEIRARSGLAPGANLWLVKLEELGRRIEEHPVVHRVAVQRIPPHRIHIVIEERVPAVFVLNADEGRMYGIDANGVVLPPYLDGSMQMRSLDERQGLAALIQSKPLVSGVVSVVTPGAVIEDERVLAGLALTQRLAEEAPALAAEITELEFRDNGNMALHPRRRAGVIVLRDVESPNLVAQLKAFWEVLETENLRAIYVDARFPEHGFAVRWDERDGQAWKKLYGNQGLLTQAAAMEL
ncbi:MAG: FtsQ-type POTRA domain-containing protein [Candidatus Hinthialibacter antarcticus]|nr:FtsQ-type POTRA domain-containing protein [Candidatus Hinthialibacter antarcticus]